MSTQIGGDEKIVKIDKSLLVKRKYERWRLLQQQWMFGGIERAENGDKHFFVELVDDRTEIALFEIIQRRIRAHTRIISDGWKAYSKLEEYGYIHEIVIHDDNFVGPVEPYVHTQNIEDIWLVFKRFLRKHGTHKAQHDYEYIAEFFFRWPNNDVFQSFLDLIKRKYQLY